LRVATDSQVLLEPYVPDLLRIADDHASPLRDFALNVLSGTWPKVSSKTLAYLAAHLADNDNTPGEAGSMACTLLRAGSDLLAHDAIAFVRKQDRHETVEAVLRCFGLHPTTNADALAFIGSSLDSPDLWIRRRAVEAVARVPLVERSPFLNQLNRLSTDPNEPTEIRSAAADALKK
jgi:HEAT repeat protein